MVVQNYFQKSSFKSTNSIEELSIYVIILMTTGTNDFSRIVSMIYGFKGEGGENEF